MVLTLDEANEKKINQDQTISVHKQETKGLKNRPSVQKKCSKAEKKANAPKELKERYEDENQNVQHQLKWKNEQFRHLEEAHDNFVYNSRQVRMNVRWRSLHYSMRFVNCR